MISHEEEKSSVARDNIRDIIGDDVQDFLAIKESIMVVLE